MLAPRVELVDARRPEERPIFSLYQAPPPSDEALEGELLEEEDDGFEPAIDAMIEAETEAPTPSPSDDDEPVESVDLGGFVEPEGGEDEASEPSDDDAGG